MLSNQFEKNTNSSSQPTAVADSYSVPEFTPYRNNPVNEILEWKESDFMPENARNINDLLAIIFLDDKRLAHVDTLISAGIFSKLFPPELLGDITIRSFIKKATSLTDIYVYFCICLAIRALNLDMSIGTISFKPDSKEKYDAVSAHIDLIYYKAHEFIMSNLLFKQSIPDGKSFEKSATFALNSHALTRPWREMEYQLSQKYDASVQFYSNETIISKMLVFYKQQLDNAPNEQTRNHAKSIIDRYNRSPVLFQASPKNSAAESQPTVNGTTVQYGRN